MSQKFERSTWEITKMRSGSDAGTSSPVSPTELSEVLVSWYLGILILGFLSILVLSKHRHILVAWLPISWFYLAANC